MVINQWVNWMILQEHPCNVYIVTYIYHKQSTIHVRKYTSFMDPLDIAIWKIYAPS